MDKNVFSAIVGYEDIKLELMRILDQLMHTEKYAALGVTEPHGLMLHGEPGVGKSTFAQCFVEACGRNVFICRKEKPNGDFVNAISQLFNEAEEKAPSVILLDDLDKFSDETGHGLDTEEFVTVQACIDRVKDKQVFVVATANDIDKLPRSLVRPGRFDHVLELSCPSGEDAHAIVAHYLSKKSYVADMDMKRIGRLMEHRSCAELETVVNLAGTYAAYEGRDQVQMRDMLKAILRFVFEAPEKSNANQQDLQIIACHEAGHALVAEWLEPDSVDLVTVLTHNSHSAGITALHREDGYFLSKKMMENRVVCLMAGKAAVELFYGTVDPGASSDLQRAFRIVQRFADDYCAYGFDKQVFDRQVSPDLLSRRDSQVAADMARFYAQALQILAENRGKLEKLTEELVREKTLLGDRVQQILKAA